MSWDDLFFGSPLKQLTQVALLPKSDITFDIREVLQQLTTVTLRVLSSSTKAGEKPSHLSIAQFHYYCLSQVQFLSIPLIHKLSTQQQSMLYYSSQLLKSTNNKLHIDLLSSAED